MEDGEGGGGEIFFDEPADEKAAAVRVGRFGPIDLGEVLMLPRSLRYAGRAHKPCARKGGLLRSG